MNPVVTANQKPTPHTQKSERKEHKNNTKENHQTTREETKGRKEERTTKTSRKQQKCNKYILTDNHFKYQWIKCSNQKTQTG